MDRCREFPGDLVGSVTALRWYDVTPYLGLPIQWEAVGALVAGLTRLSRPV
jgi:hypothetical protein